MCYISMTSDEDGIVRLFDGRRVALSLPSVQDMMSDLVGVTAPDGSSYTFLTEIQVAALGQVRTQDDLFVMVSHVVCVCRILITSRMV